MKHNKAQKSLCYSLDKPIRALENGLSMPIIDRGAYLRTLMENVISQAKSATSNTEASAFCRVHIPSFRGSIVWLTSASVQDPVTSESEANAKLRLAESKTIKKISRRRRRALAEGERKPKGFDVYSSKVMYRR